MTNAVGVSCCGRCKEGRKGPLPALMSLDPLAEACTAQRRLQRLVCGGGAHGQPSAFLHGDAFILQSGPPGGLRLAWESSQKGVM